MDVNSIYWALSTLPQVSAALIAFIGFLVLQSVVDISEKCKTLEERARQYVRGNFKRLQSGELRRTRLGEVDFMSGSKLMLLVRKDYDQHKDSDAFKWFQHVIPFWTPLHDFRRRTYRTLTVFVTWNLFLVLICLGSLPFSPKLATIEGLKYAWIVACLSVVLTTAVVVYEAIYRERP